MQENNPVDESFKQKEKNEEPIVPNGEIHQVLESQQHPPSENDVFLEDNSNVSSISKVFDSEQTNVQPDDAVKNTGSPDSVILLEMKALMLNLANDFEQKLKYDLSK